MRCPRCGWPMRVTRTKRILDKLLTSFTCTSPPCEHEQTQIG